MTNHNLTAILATYCFRTFATEAEAAGMRDALHHAFCNRALRALIAVEYSGYVYRWVLKCHPADARALYVKSIEISPIGL